MAVCHPPEKRLTLTFTGPPNGTGGTVRNSLRRLRCNVLLGVLAKWRDFRLRPVHISLLSPLLFLYADENVSEAVPVWRRRVFYSVCCLYIFALEPFYAFQAIQILERLLNVLLR